MPTEVRRRWRALPSDCRMGAQKRKGLTISPEILGVEKRGLACRPALVACGPGHQLAVFTNDDWCVPAGKESCIAVDHIRPPQVAYVYRGVADKKWKPSKH